MNVVFILVFFTFATADGKRVDGLVDFDAHKTRETCEAGAEVHRNRLMREFPKSRFGFECIPLNYKPANQT
jgi:hypothetical protein